MNSLIYLDFGGGKINRRSMLLALMLFSLALPLGTNLSSATAPGSVATQDQTGIADQSTGQYLTGNATNLSSENVQQTEQSVKRQAQEKQNQSGEQQTTRNQTESLAAGSTSTTTTSQTLTITISQLTQAASSIKTFVDTNHRLPNYVTISGQPITMSQYLLLITDGILNLNSGKTSAVTLKSVNSPISPTESIKAGTILKAEYIQLATNLKTFINTNGRLPNYVTSSVGKIRYESLIYMYSKIFVFYGTNNRLPTSVSISPWVSLPEGVTDPNLLQYLKPTANCQSTDPAITSLSASITAGLTSSYSKATAIFNWVRDHVTYSFYYNTKKGALGTLSSRTANCCDTSHLVIALARAAGIPARYQYGSCKFPDGVFGHVWAQLNVGGTWYYADAIAKNNTLGTIKNWNLSTYTLKGTYAELPF